MITIQSNNKASGFASKQCDAGTAISGRTNDTGTYEIIKVSSEGEIITAFEDADKAISNHPFVIDVTSVALLGTFFKIVPLTAVILDVPACTWATQDNGVMDATLLIGVTLSGNSAPIYMKMTSVKVLSGTLMVYVSPTP